MEPLLEVKGLVTNFFTESGIVEALAGIDLTVFPKESVGVVGESGCGKTQTAYSILRILASNGKIMSGQVLYKGQDLIQLSESEMRRVRGKEIAMIFQDPMTSLNPVLKISDQMIEVIAMHRDISEIEARELAIESLASVGLSDAADRIDEYPHKFSGGMRQRILIARALALRPSLLIADEPTTALDVTIQAQVLEIIKDMKEQYNLALMLITHNLGVVAELTDRVHIFYGGRVAEVASTYNIFTMPMHPYTIALLESIPSLDVEKGRLATIPGSVPQLINPPKGCRFHPRCKYAKEKCSIDIPVLEEKETGRFVACHFWKDVEVSELAEQVMGSQKDKIKGKT
ncbi:MAG: ABC transporter ATP-binding protein [Candidatus Heimdallarchaeota archaeon]|nr:ABC transporter ATP-binding protein [Candidatus Heimdallarchaeota archaeon]MCK4289586.1 ABC transporter ATP-binding protein [Candidatus Heimdallarchaeota archaeon]